MPGALAGGRMGVIAMLILAVALSACGRRGDPLPPPGADTVAPVADESATPPATP